MVIEIVVAAITIAKEIVPVVAVETVTTVVGAEILVVTVVLR